MPLSSPKGVQIGRGDHVPSQLTKFVSARLFDCLHVFMKWRQQLNAISQLDIIVVFARHNCGFWPG